MTSAAINEEELLGLATQRAPEIAAEPRGRFTLRVGVIGHRLLNEDQVTSVRTAASLVLSRLRRALDEKSVGSAASRSFVGNSRLVLISSLAEGADRIVSTIGLNQGCTLGAILPFSIEKYEGTFNNPDEQSAERFRDLLGVAESTGGFGVRVLDGDWRADHQDESYLRCSNAILDASDILVAVLSDRRLDSHTGVVVETALEADLPVIAIDPSSNPSAIRVNGQFCPIDALDREIGKMLERGPEQVSSTPPKTSHSYRPGLIEYVDEKILGASRLTAGVETFRAQTIAPAWIAWCAGLHRILDASASRLMRLPRPHRKKESLDGLTTIGLSPAAASWLVDLYLRFARADSLANAYGELHRSGQIVMVTLGVGTIFFGSIIPSIGFGRSAFAGAELFCLLAALAVVWKASRQAWLERWLNYRLLAEICRSMRFLLLADRETPFEPDEAVIPRDQNWVREHIQTLLGEQPLASLTADGAADQSGRAAIRTYILEYFFAPQIDYHKTTCEMRRKLAEGLRTATFAMSLLTTVVVALKFAVSLKWGVQTQSAIGFQYGLNIAAVVFPAVTGAVFALRAFGEHDVVATRSRNVSLLLEAQQSTIQNAKNSRDVGEITLRAARMLLREVDGWLDIFADKQLE